MESSHGRNVGISKFVNDCLYDTLTPAQTKDPRYRNSINGFPCILYLNDELQGVYNFNLDRYSRRAFGYHEFGDDCLVYEISANTDSSAGAFISNTSSSGKGDKEYYASDFMCIYPENRRMGDDSYQEIKELVEFVDLSSDEVFRDNFDAHFNKEYLIRFYLTVMCFGAVDNLGKNAKIANFGDGRWYFQFYDCDTALGLDKNIVQPYSNIRI